MFQFRSVFLGCRGVFDIFWILDMLAPGDAPLLSLACILQPSGVFFAIAAKMGLRQINLKSGKYVDTAKNMHILLHFMRVKLYVICIGQSVYFFLLYLMMLCFFLIPFPDYNLWLQSNLRCNWSFATNCDQLTSSSISSLSYLANCDHLTMIWKAAKHKQYPPMF